MLLVRAVFLLVVGAGLAGCGAPPPPGEEPPPDVPTSTLIVMDAVIVDVNPDAGTLTVKDDRSHDTWTIAVGTDTRILGPDAGSVALGDLRIGANVQIRGRSRIPWILIAEEVSVQEEQRKP